MNIRRFFKKQKNTGDIENAPKNQNTTTTQGNKIHEKWSIFSGGRRSDLMSTVIKDGLYTLNLIMESRFFTNGQKLP